MLCTLFELSSVCHCIHIHMTYLLLLGIEATKYPFQASNYMYQVWLQHTVYRSIANTPLTNRLSTELKVQINA